MAGPGGGGVRVAERLAMQVPPPRPFVWHQNWLQLLFLHWSVPVEVLRPLIPPGLTIDTYAGQAWLGIVPFRMTNVRPRWIPYFRSLSAFPELNVRTYVHLDGRSPGVWFFSLDATNPLAVEAARAAFRLPYFHCRIGLRRDGLEVAYHARRHDRRSPAAHLDLRYRIGPALPPAPPDSLAFFLTERYCLYAEPRPGALSRLRVHHRPWPLHAASLTDLDTNLAEADGLAPLAGVPLLHYAPRVDVRVWNLEQLR
ncbi:MAG: DUF2071 domain-containing protein [Dehalococcoidia bacterium]